MSHGHLSHYVVLKHCLCFIPEYCNETNLERDFSKFSTINHFLIYSKELNVRLIRKSTILSQCFESTFDTSTSIYRYSSFVIDNNSFKLIFEHLTP